MVILEDSRQQAHSHDKKHKWFLENGIHINRCALQCGDYQIPADGSIAVDTKKDIAELIGDIQVKTIPKKKVREEVDKILFDMDAEIREDIYCMITDDDSDRFVEHELNEFCFRNNIDEMRMKKLQELYVKKHGFFHRGLLRSKNYGIELHILVENLDGVKSIDDLFKWVNPRRKYMVRGPQIGWYQNGKPKYKMVQKYPTCMMGEQIAKACLTMQLKYGVKFDFCTPEESAERIVGILTRKM